MAAVSRPLASGPPLVGRTVHCRRIAGAIDAAQRRTPCLLVLRGRAGMGKTRLGREGLLAAQHAGFRALFGRADELSRHVALTPIVEALSPMLMAMTANSRTKIGNRLPQLALVFDGLGSAAPPPLRDGALEQRRIIDGVARLIDSACTTKPVALMIDDVQAADDLTLSCLGRLARLTARILLICTVNTDTDDQTARLAAGFRDSSWRVEDIEVGPLAPDDAETLFDSVAEIGIGRDYRDRAVDRCAGIPFFLETMASHLSSLTRDDGHPCGDGAADDTEWLPGPVRDELRRQLRGLSPDAYCVAELLAVGGTRCSFRALLACSSLGRRRQIAALTELEARRLVIALPDGDYALAHGLLQSAIAADMTRTETYRRHAAFAAALATADPTDLRAAEHVIRAGPLADAVRALPILVQAGARARLLGATDDAVKFYKAALPFAEALKFDGQRAAIHEQLSALSAMALKPAEAREHAATALAIHRARHDHAGISRAESAQCRLSWSAGDVDAALGHLDAARTARARLAPSASDIDFLSLEVSVASRLGDVRRIADTADRMRQLAERFPSPELTARAHLAAAIATFIRTDYRRAVDECEEAVAIARRGDDAGLIIGAYDQLSLFALANGDIAKSADASRESLRATRRAGAAALETWPRLRLAIVHLLTGHFARVVDECRELLELAESNGERRGSVNILATRALAETRLGRLDDAGASIDRAMHAGPASLYTDIHTTAPLATARTVLALAAGDNSAAADSGRVLANIGTGAYPLISAAVYAEALGRAGRSRDARLLRAAVHDVSSCSTTLASAVESWMTGLAGGDREASARASAGFAALGFPYWQGKCLLLAAATADRQAAIEAASAALDLFERLPAPAEAQAARGLLRGWGVVPSRGRPRSHSRLTGREREVADLAAAGQSSAAIAARLFISTRTVTTHLERIYAKTGVHSRIELANYLAQTGSRPASGASLTAKDT